MTDPVLTVESLVKHYPVHGGTVHAVDGVNLSIAPGETLGLVGESGCGKSSLARCILRLVRPDAGRILLGGQDITHIPEHRMRKLRRHVQMVFQDPFASLNPRHTAGRIVAEPLCNFRIATGPALQERVAALFMHVGLRPDQMQRMPHEFSGGQRQRLGIARALALQPDLIVLDEPVSALDVSVQAQVLNLLRDLQEEFHLAYLFVAHDLAVVAHVSHRVAVMYLGRIVETGTRTDIFTTPRHPYTQALLQSVPKPDPSSPRRAPPLSGDLPSPLAPPPGCRFHTRCPLAIPRCREETPAPRYLTATQQVACHRA
jgi:peptide/nickel transport system ATP-binding protein/oligopeptide transport system ATP-binding protein